MSDINQLGRMINNLYTAVFQHGTQAKKVNAVLRFSLQQRDTITLEETSYGIDVNLIPRARYGGPLTVASSDTDAAASAYGITNSAQRLQYSSGVLYDNVMSNKTGWMILSVKLNWAAAGVLGRDATILYWASASNNYLWIAWDDASNKWKVERSTPSGVATSLGALDAHTAASTHQLAFWWTDTQVGIAIDSAAATVTPNAQGSNQTAKTFDIGTKGGPNIQLLDGSINWMVIGTGTLTDADIANYNATFGSFDPADFTTLPDFGTTKPSFLWKAVDVNPDSPAKYGEGVYAT